MTLFGKKIFCRGSPCILSFFSGFLKENRVIFLTSFGWAIKQTTPRIFPSKMITKFLLTQRSSHLKPQPKMTIKFLGYFHRLGLSPFSCVQPALVYNAWASSSFYPPAGSSLAKLSSLLTKLI